MNPVSYAALLGLDRGWREFRQSLTSAQDMGFSVFFAVVFVVVLFFQRGSTVEGTAWPDGSRVRTWSSVASRPCSGSAAER